jgi:magnesium transporter
VKKPLNLFGAFSHVPIPQHPRRLLRRGRKRTWSEGFLPHNLNETVAEASRRLASQQAEAFESSEGLLVTDADQRLQGVVPWHRFLAAAPRTLISELKVDEIASVAVGNPPAQAAEIALGQKASMVPVVDENSRLLGVIPAQAIFQILREAHTQEMDRLVGIPTQSEQALFAIEGDPVRRTVRRLPWLFVGTLGSLLAAGPMANFENTLRADLAVAFFVPGIVYLADAIGTQSEAIAVRGLSFSRVPIRQLWRSEFTTGLCLGITLAVLLFPFVWLMFSASLALAVSVSLVFASSVASSIGLLFPWMLTELGRDPAYGSGPLATIIQDLLSLLIYLVTVSLLIF